jgi:3-isopropylmalate dehydrogenase
LKSEYFVAAIIGDGVGPEVLEGAIKVLDVACKESSVNVSVEKVESGDGALKKFGKALPPKSEEVIRNSDACLKAPVGDTAADVILKLRQEMDLYANLRPIRSYHDSRPEIDFAIVRENTEDLYKGMETSFDDSAIAVMLITRNSSKRIAEFAFNLARQRKLVQNGNYKEQKAGAVVAVHKANVLRKTCGLFLEECRKVASDFPYVKYSEMLVDAAAMQIARDASQFDVLLTTNMFGDILSDEAAEVAGSLGLAPSGNFGKDFAIFEPVHGAALDIAGKGIANPVAMVLSAKMMLEYLGDKNHDNACKNASALIDSSVAFLLHGRNRELLTPDLGGKGSTKGMTEAICDALVSKHPRKILATATTTVTKRS